MKKPKQYFITDKEYQKALEQFHNGLDYTKHIDFKETMFEKEIKDITLLEEILEEGEEAYSIPESPLAITSLGRMINLRWIRMVKPTFHNRDIYFNIAKNYMGSRLFQEAGWEYDRVDILNNYRSRGWKHREGESCSYC